MPVRTCMLALFLLRSSCVPIPPGGGDPPGTPECPTPSLAPGRHQMTLMHDGIERHFDVYVPESYDGETRVPLVFNFHPWFLGESLHWLWTVGSRMNQKAEEEGFIVIQPDGTGSPASWNAGELCCPPASTDDVDDVGFVGALLDFADETLCTDSRRTYAAGMSNGGYFSHRLACEHPEWFAAIAPVVGALGPDLTCADGRSVPVFQITGTEDGLVPASQTDASVARWVEIDGCTDHTVVTYQQGAVTCTTHDQCDDGVEVTHCSVEGGGHCWFNDSTAESGCSTPGFAAEDAAWEFFERWSL